MCSPLYKLSIDHCDFQIYCTGTGEYCCCCYGLCSIHRVYQVPDFDSNVYSTPVIKDVRRRHLYPLTDVDALKDSLHEKTCGRQV